MSKYSQLTKLHSVQWGRSGNNLSAHIRGDRRHTDLTKFSGFTLVELMITISIAAILMTVGVPSYKYVTNANRIASEVNGLLGDMQYARAEAIKEGLPVTVCVSTNGTSCTSQTDWKNGWIVFSDANGNATVDGGDTIQRVQKTFASTDTFQATNTVAAVTFNREGFAVGNANGALIKLHDVTNTSGWTRCLFINMSGMMKTLTYNATFNSVTCT